MVASSFLQPGPAATTPWIGRRARRGLAIGSMASGILCTGPALAADAPRLAWFAGAWQCAGRFEPSGKPIEASVRFDWNEAAGALVKHHDDRSPNLYHAVELWGSDGQAGQIGRAHV